MKIYLFTALMLLGSAANARVLNIGVGDPADGGGQTFLVVTAELCKGSAQFITPTVKKMANDAVLVNLDIATPVDHCKSDVLSTQFILSIDANIRALGMNPKTVKIFTQIQ